VIEEEYQYDIADLFDGQVVAIKKLGYSNRKSAELILQWGFQISHTTVVNMWKRYESEEPFN
jgi:hypothetical protein